MARIESAVVRAMGSMETKLTVLGREEIAPSYLRLEMDDGGMLARRPPHPTMWLRLWFADGGRGHCFPAGHAMAGFSFVGGYWVFRDSQPRLARIWLAAALCAGLLLGLAQQWRGAHFMSHTLWSGWIACAATMALDAVITSMSTAKTAIGVKP